MGLDLMLYHCQKPNGLNNGDILSYAEKQKYKDQGVSFMHLEEISAYCPTIKLNAVEVIAEDEYYDVTLIALKLCEENHLDYSSEIEDELVQFHVNSEEYCFGYEDEDNNVYKTIIPSDDIELYYTHKKVEVYAIAMNEVAYQRKGLNSKGWELMPCENCEYSDDFEGVKKMVEEGGLSQDFVDEWVEGETVFCPWW